MKKLTLFILLTLNSPTLAQTNPNFIEGAHLCANYPNTTCSNDPIANPLSLNQAFANKMDFNQPTTISQLPACNTNSVGVRMYVADGQASPTYLSTVSVSGGTFASVFCNGNNWVYGWCSLSMREMLHMSTKIL